MQPYPSQRTLLAILAHPDDESFGLGGTLAYYAQAGVQCHLICLTDGSAGTVDEELLADGKTIASLRSEELNCAAKILGLASVETGWYHDSGMAGSPDNNHLDALSAQPVESVACRIASHIRKIRPQIVITHDPIGGYMHPDHIAAQRATEFAIKIAGDPGACQDSGMPPYSPEKLYYNTFPKGFFVPAVRILKLLGMREQRFGRNKDIDFFHIIEAGDFPIHVRINIQKYSQVKTAASNCHQSQLAGGPGSGGVLGLFFQWLFRYEYFTRAVPEPPRRLKERDLFDQLK